MTARADVPRELISAFVSHPRLRIVRRGSGRPSTLGAGQKVPGFDLDKAWGDHLGGKRRLGLFPTREDGLCSWGCVDLDAHDADTPCRIPEAVWLVEFLLERYVSAYWEASPGGRGAHVFLFFDDPGVPQRDLFVFLEELARQLRVIGRVDVFPSVPEGVGGAVFMPYWEGALALYDSWLVPTRWDKLEPNKPAVIPHQTSPPMVSEWPPPEWRTGRGRATSASSGIPEEVKAAMDEGMVFHGADGLWRARSGARNLVAGRVASLLCKRGRTFRDFQEWDSGNIPPLSTDEPGRLERWWKWATRKETRGSYRVRKDAPHR